jgi:hypothetical protein
MLYPDAFVNPKGQQGLSANPSTQHYLTYDVYTFINQATNKAQSDTSTYLSHIVQKKGDTIYLNSGFMIFNGFSKLCRGHLVHAVITAYIHRKRAPSEDEALSNECY